MSVEKNTTIFSTGPEPPVFLDTAF